MEERPIYSEAQNQSLGRRLTNPTYWILIGLGALAVILAGLVWERFDPARAQAFFGNLVEVDLEQTRIDTALPIPQGDLVITQTFVPHHDGLEEIELTLARYGEAADDPNGRLSLQLFDEDGRLVVSRDLETAALTHNQEFRLPIPRQSNSAGQQYELQISGSTDNLVSVWGYSLDVYEGGAVTLSSGQNPGQLPASAAQDLRFITRYRLTGLGAVQTILETLYYEGLLFVLALLMLPLPGCLLLLLFHFRWVSGIKNEERRLTDGWPWDPAAWWGAAFALGAATWPLLWMWLTLIGGRWTSWLLWLVVAAGWLLAFVLWWWDKEKRRKRVHGAEDLSTLPPHPPLTLPWQWDHLLLLLIILAGFALRLLAVRDVSFPPWVDSSRHGLITAVMTASGQAISNYAPFLPVDRFPYHFGFHALATNLALMSSWPLNRLLLYFGQLLNALVPLALYTGAWLFVRRRGVGMLAAFLVAIPFFFPAYYATWGRFTQLTAVFMMPLLLALTWRLLRGRSGWQRVWWLVALLAAGLFLTHFRVFLYYLPFALLVWVFSLGRNTRWLAAAAGLTLLFISPRLVQLLQDTNPVRRLSQTIPDYNSFPISYVETGWEQVFLAAAAFSVVVLVIGIFRRKSWVWAPLLLLLWAASLFLLLSADRIGLLVTSLVNLNSMYIILFVPLALFLSFVSAPIMDWLGDQNRLVQVAGLLLAGFLFGAMILFGSRQQIGILNAQTILAKEEDLPALKWVNDHLPADATLAVNSWRWLGETWAAADGGAWLVPLTGRASTTPPIDHIYNPDLFQYVREFNQEAAAVSDWSDPAQAQWLREQGITHIFVGKKGGFFDPAVLSRNPQLEMVYGQRGVFIFAVNE